MGDIKTNYASLLNALSQMQESPAYAVRRSVLADAENVIVSLKSELATAKADQRKKDAEIARSHKLFMFPWVSAEGLAHDGLCEEIANAIERGE